MKLIVGLGNPGEKYAKNRHNIGFMAADEIARGYSFSSWKKRFQGYAAEGQIGLEKCILLKPSTYMNESGRSAGEAIRFYKLPVGDVIVIHDDIDLKPGAIRVKKGGGNAGHNGLKSISAYIGNDYVRLRLGVDHPGDKALVVNHVLQDFAKSDRDWLLPLLEGVARGMPKLVEGNEAAFLGEAARHRQPQAQAAKDKGAAPEPRTSRQGFDRDFDEGAALGPQTGETVLDSALAAAAAHEVELIRAQAGEPLFETTPEDRANEDEIRGPRRLYERPDEDASEEGSRKDEGNAFMRWFRRRVRGGAK